MGNVIAFKKGKDSTKRMMIASHMDEIGFMEASSEAFCSGIFRLLDGDIPVLAAVKDKDTPFLQAVRNHPKTTCYHLTEDNREALFQQILANF